MSSREGSISIRVRRAHVNTICLRGRPQEWHGGRSQRIERERDRENEGGFINLLGASVGHTSHGNVER